MKAPVFESLFKQTLFKKRHRCSCFPVKNAKILRTAFLVEHLRWLFLILGFCLNRCSIKSCSKPNTFLFLIKVYDKDTAAKFWK